MYTINTQLAYFNYKPDSKKMIVNIKWFKLDKLNELYVRCKAFNKLEINQFSGFIDQNRLNFPGLSFIEQTEKRQFEILRRNELSINGLPLYLILSKNPDLNLYNNNDIVRTILKDKDYKINIDYTLNFESIGKIEIYKECKI